MEVDVWDPAEARTLVNLRDGIIPNTTYTDLFCSMQVQNSHNHSTMTVGGDDGLGGNAPNDAAIGVTSYSTNNGLQNEAPMNFPRWYPTGTTMPNGDIVVQGGSLRGGPGGPGVLTPEIYTPDDGSGWKTLDGATSAAAYGDGGSGLGPDENRWWYPRAFVAPGQRQPVQHQRHPDVRARPRGQRRRGPADAARHPAGRRRQPGDQRQPGRRDVDGHHVPPRQDPAGRRRLVGQRRGPGRRPRRLHGRHHRRHGRAGHRGHRADEVPAPLGDLDRPPRRRRARHRRRPREQRQRRLRHQRRDLGPRDRGLDRGRRAVRARPSLPLGGPAAARRPRDDGRRRCPGTAQLHRRRVLLPVVPLRRQRAGRAPRDHQRAGDDRLRRRLPDHRVRRRSPASRWSGTGRSRTGSTTTRTSRTSRSPRAEAR